MKKSDVFKSRYLTASDLDGQPVVLTVERAALTPMKGFNGGEERQKMVLHFKGAKKALVLNSTRWDDMIDATGKDDTDDWVGCRVEVYPATTPVDGKVVDCVR